MLFRHDYCIHVITTFLMLLTIAYSQTAFPPGLPSGVECNVTGMSPYVSVSGVGWEGQGAGIAIADINRNGKDDIILMAYDNPAGQNTFRYRIGWDVNFSTGNATSWTSNFITVNGVGGEGQGAGIEIADLDHNNIKDMVLMAYDNPAGRNNFRYKIGWNLRTNGQATSWSNTTMIDGVGDDGAGAGIAIADLNHNGQLDMVLMANDLRQGINHFYYRIGWDLNNSGTTTNWSTNPIRVNGVGNESEGADIDIADIDLDGNLDMIVMAYDNPQWNNFRYRIGWNIQSNGIPRDWSRYFMLKGVGTVGQGAGICYNIYSYYSQKTPILAFMAYDAPAGANNFRYFVLPVTTSGTCFGYADDLPPTANNQLSVPVNISDQYGYKLFNLNMSEVQQTARDALALYVLGCMFAHLFGEDPVPCWVNYPDSDVKCDFVFANSNFSEKIGPDILVAAVAWYVDAYMSWVNDAANTYVLNTIHNLNYAPGGEGMPAYYIIHYTDPSRYPNMINQLDNQNHNWALAYGDGKLYHGDCEDHAILRHSLLRALGFDRNFIWNGRQPGHEYNIVLYKGTYRIMDYGPIYSYLCNPGHGTLNEAWKQSRGPRFSSSTKDWLLKLVLNRLYPDRCGVGYGLLFGRKYRSDIESNRHCP